MDATEIFQERLDAYMQRIEEAIDDISEDDLMRQPGPNDNPIGWLMWHMTRYEDRTVAHITGKVQAWSEGRWYEKFRLPEASEQTGMGQTLEEVMALRPTKEALLGYARAVRQKTTACLQGLSAGDLGREIDDFSGHRKIAVGLLLGRFFGDHISHVGQIVYLRGHFCGWGRYPR